MESLRRVLGSGSAEYRAACEALLTGKAASEALAAANLDGAGGGGGGTAPAAYPLTPSTSNPTTPLFPAAHPPSYAVPPSVSASAGWDWSQLWLSAAALLGLGSSAFLLARPHLPSIHLTWQQPAPPANSSSSQAASTAFAALSSPSSPHSAHAAAVDGLHLTSPSPAALVPPALYPPPTPAPASSAVSSAFPGQLVAASPSSSSDASSVDRVGVRVLLSDDSQREERLLRAMGDLKEEVLEIASSLREAAMDHKRTLLALQQSVDAQAKERKEEAKRSSLQQQQQQQQQLSNGNHLAKVEGGAEVERSSGPATPASSAPVWSAVSSAKAGDVDGSARRSPRLKPPSSGEWSNSAVRADDSPTSSGSTTPPPPHSPPPTAAASVTAALSPTLSDANNSSSAVSTAAPLPSTSTPTLAPIPPLAPPLSMTPVQGRMMQLRAALSLLTRSSSVEVCQSSLQALSLYLHNLHANMSSTRYRKVLTTNAVYQSRVQPVPGAVEVLLAAGFVLRGAFLEWGVVEEDREVDVQVLAEAREAIHTTQQNLTVHQQQPQQGSASSHPASTSAAKAAPLSFPSPTSQPLQSPDSRNGADE